MDEHGSQWPIILSFGLFSIVVLAFTLLQLLRRPAPKKQTLREEDILAQFATQGVDAHTITIFRDDIMARLDRIFEERSSQERPTLHPTEPIAFELRAEDDERETLCIVLTRVLQGSLEYPDQEDIFKDHFVNEVFQTWSNSPNTSPHHDA